VAVLRTEEVGGSPDGTIGAEAFVVRRPEVPALAGRAGHGRIANSAPPARVPLIYSQDRLHALPPGTLNGIPSSAEGRWPAWVDDATLARIASEPKSSIQLAARRRPPPVAGLVADRFGRAGGWPGPVDPMLGGVYAGVGGDDRRSLGRPRPWPPLSTPVPPT